jgi:hypothetical protein
MHPAFRFHSPINIVWQFTFSLYNVMLIASQRPDATRVAGYHKWREFGRFVKKGAKGIFILAPILAKKTAEQDRQTANALRSFFQFARTKNWCPAVLPDRNASLWFLRFGPKTNEGDDAQTQKNAQRLISIRHCLSSRMSRC